ncbi:AAA family ATPase [Nocardiopsis synnemataformans]|uniref:phosphatase domain-containing protein n=1 Tax=Nocardiopsis synnemataformans TaxID=61305 RepID=UPI003EC122E3
MSTLYIIRGLPGSGKTDWARRWTAADPERRARVNGDELRAMANNGWWVKDVAEGRTRATRDAVIGALLGRGLDVVCDDTNLQPRVVRALARLAERHGAEFEVHDLTDVPVDECVARDARRGHPVGEETIRDLHARYVAGNNHPLPLPVDDAEEEGPRWYTPPGDAPAAVIVDVDGTVALHGDRSPYDESRVHEDRPNTAVVDVVRALAAAGNRVLFVSARTDACEAETRAWLERHVGVPIEALHMRKAGDFRKDYQVKADLFDAHIRHAYAVACVVDDRQQVVRMWRSIGLTVLHVAEGAY